MSEAIKNRCVRHAYEWGHDGECVYCVLEQMSGFQPLPPTAPKFCKDCKWMVPNEYGTDEYNKCSCPQSKFNRAMLPVIGRTTVNSFCNIERSADYDGYCGPEGKFFEQAPPPPPPKPSIWDRLFSFLTQD